MKKASLIALDWGTSSLRASLLDAAGHELETRSTAGGIMTVKDGQFSPVLQSLCGDWMDRFDDPLIASGMIGSRQGWKEAPYLDCPASLGQVARHLLPVELTPGGEGSGKPPRHLHIVPGLRCLEGNGQFDVMRGEETQVWGARLAPGSVCVLPGTHSKWAWLGQDGGIERFRTYMTGEQYGLNTQHGILGRLMVFGAARPDAFVQGVQVGVAAHAQALHALFSARTAGLMGSLQPDALPDYFSGLLIGIELGSAMTSSQSGKPAQVTLIGDDALCERYAMAFEVVGVPTVRAAANATTQGQFMIARAAGLIQEIQ